LHCDAFVNAQAFHHHSFFFFGRMVPARRAVGLCWLIFSVMGVTMGHKSRAPTVKQRRIFSTKQRPKLGSSRDHFRLFFSLLEKEGSIPGLQDIAVMGNLSWKVPSIGVGC
jgi:hypothetical protein